MGKAHRTVRFGVAPERALGVHTLKPEPTVVAPLLALVDICGGRQINDLMRNEEVFKLQNRQFNYLLKKV